MSDFCFGIGVPVAGVEFDGDAAVGQVGVGFEVEYPVVGRGLRQLYVDEALIEVVMEASPDEVFHFTGVASDAGCSIFGDGGEFAAYPEARDEGSLQFQLVENFAEGVGVVGFHGEDLHARACQYRKGGIRDDNPISRPQTGQLGGDLRSQLLQILSSCLGVFFPLCSCICADTSRQNARQSEGSQKKGEKGKGVVHVRG